MNARFANRLPPIYQRDQVPIDSAVRVLLRDIEGSKRCLSGCDQHSTPDGAYNVVMLPVRLTELRAGDEFFEDIAGEMMPCVALGACAEDGLGYSLQARTPFGDREMYERASGKRLKLYRHQPLEKR
jgi:hypothetical protein